MANNKNMNKNSNAKRFISSYNQIDMALRTQGDMKRSISYTEAVRRAARTNPIVQKYEDVLVDYGRLRNAIVHSNNDNYVIAEPNIEAVEMYEKIATLICTPPLAIETVAKKVLGGLEFNTTLKDTIEYSYKSGFSSVPVYKKGMLIGVANGQKILDVIGKKIYEKHDLNDYIENTKIEDVLKEFKTDNFYTVVNDKITLDKVMSLFSENRKLLLVLINKTGSLLEKPIGIVTISDLANMNKILDNYNMQ